VILKAPPCTCACCGNKIAALGEIWCTSKTHPNPPQSLRAVLAVKSCDHWIPESNDYPRTEAAWLQEIIDRSLF
jgi:hypothetical protein